MASAEQNLEIYKQAADIVEKIKEERNIQFSVSPEEIDAFIADFRKKYGPEALKALDDDSILQAMFYTQGDNKDCLCYYLEQNKKCINYFGSISGGSSYKFGLYQNKESGKWLSGSPVSPTELTYEEALAKAKKIRNILINCSAIIARTALDTIEDYESLDKILRSELGSYYELSWIHKYFCILNSQKLCAFHSDNWQKHVLMSLKVTPDDRYYVRSGQIALILRQIDWNYRQFFDVFFPVYSDPKSFLRVDTSVYDPGYAAFCAGKGEIAIGWKELGDLTAYTSGKEVDINKLKKKLETLDISKKRATEAARFYNADKNTIFVIMDGEHLIAVADNVGAYAYVPDSDMAQIRKATWHFIFNVDDKLPETEKLDTDCKEISKEKNIQFLYEKYFYSEDKGNNITHTETLKAVSFRTGYKSEFERNRIIFGAPGTGKSHELNSQVKKLIGDNNETDYERVTFHPDYTYSSFVGTYKPVPCKLEDGRDSITYKYVPGPFMRVYAKALKNSREAVIRPFILVIEEINRANAAAVFGDIFQLLDRDEDGVSEYPIQASEDIRKYLEEKLEGNADDYAKIRIPDNMFIWATMNSADQGVFPLDTAFKRRWDFTYLGIDENEEGIKGKKVVLGEGDKQLTVEWNELRKAINKELLSYNINEDKLLGPYFISKTNIPTGDMFDREKFSRVFKNKVLMYLFDDAAKHKRAALFEGCEDCHKNQYSAICREFDTKGIFIFSSRIIEMINKLSGEVVS